MIADTDARKIIIETIAYENTNPQCKRMIMALKAKSVHLEDWIFGIININAPEYDKDPWITEVISRG